MENTTEYPDMWASSVDQTTVVDDTSYPIKVMSQSTQTSNMTSQSDSSYEDSRRIHLAFYTLIGSIGMLDNGLVILIIMLSKTMRPKVCNMLIIHQSIVDFLGSFFLVTNSPLAVNGRPPSGLLGQLYCRFWANSFFLFTTFLISVVNLVLITLERFAEIVHPITYKVYFTKRRVYVAIGFLWLICPGINFALVGYASKLDITGLFCAVFQNYPSKEVRIVDGVLVYMLAVVIPLVVMAYCYIRMLSAMKKVSPALSSFSAAERVRHERQQRIRRNLIKTLLTVSVAYIMCVAWNQTYFFIMNLGIALPYNTPFYHFTVYALFTNCLINPLIYTVRYREFQNSAKAFIKRLIPCASWRAQPDHNSKTITVLVHIS